MIVPADRYAMHILLIEHGRKTCRAINPKCAECTLLDLCPTGQRKVGLLASRRGAQMIGRQPHVLARALAPRAGKRFGR